MEIRDENLQKKVDMTKGTPLANSIYGELVEHLIEQKYNIKQEIAINRQRDEKPEQFNTYNSYCEECKAKAKEILGI